VAKLGINAKLYRNTGTYGTPVLTEVALVSDGTLNMTWDEAEADARESRVHQVVKTMLGLDFTFRLKKKPLDANYEALMNLFLNDGSEDMWFLDGPENVEGTRGVRFDAQILSATEDQAMGNALYEDMIAKPLIGTNPVLAVKVGAAGVKTFSPFGDGGGVFA
jgi:hypothetical protein